MMNRRRFLGSSTVAVTLLSGANSFGQDAVGIRKSAKSLSAGEWDTLDRGVAAMKGLAKSDPRSWGFQANIHGFVPGTEPQVYQGWGTCQHGNWWFLPWHRAYLLYFEKILRDACGDPGFMLPYWDWTDPDQRALPDRFLDPNSSLFLDGRNDAYAQGAGLPDEVVDWQTAFLETSFSIPAQARGFGGPFEPTAGAQGPHGALESDAHDGVHDQIGGLMGSPSTAANDPIFWLHHANVDRLWGQWLAQGGGRQNPADGTWLDAQFWFYGPQGVGGVVTPRSVLATEPLGYRYESDQAPQVALAQAPAAPSIASVPRAAPPSVIVPPTRPAPPVVLGSQPPPSSVLGPEPQSVTFKLGPEPKAHVERVLAAPRAGIASVPDAPRVQVAIDDIKFEGSPGRNYAVYLNLPGPADATGPKSPYYAGLLSFFALHNHDQAGHAMGGGKTAVIDVTEAVHRLRAMGKMQGDIKVTLVEVKAKPSRRPRIAAAPRPAPPAPRVTIGSIRLLKTGN